MSGFTCSNCGADFGLHCRTHVVPCCPGKCPKARPSWPVAAAPPGGICIVVRRRDDGTFSVEREADA